MKSVLTTYQSQKMTKEYTLRGEHFKMIAEIRHDDSCGNGHNSFSITSMVYVKKGSQWKEYSGGCNHDKIIKNFPELKKYIKWHLFTSDGPIHYLANTLYHAGNRDHEGKAMGEPNLWDKFIKFGDFPIPIEVDNDFYDFLKECEGKYDFEIIGISHDDRKTYGTKYTFGGYGKKWYDCPFDTEREALNFLDALKNYDPQFVELPVTFNDGKEREFDAARRSAVWPEATDEQLSLPREELEKLLIDRLPALIEEFRKDVEELGFVF